METIKRTHNPVPHFSALFSSSIVALPFIAVYVLQCHISYFIRYYDNCCYF